MFLLVGCPSSDDPPPIIPCPADNPECENPSSIMKGSAFIPAGSSSPKTGLSKVLPGTTAFNGATVNAKSLTTGTTFPGVGSIAADGSFSIEGTPFGDEYIITARKGNIVVMKYVSVPGDAGSPFEMGEIDASTTAALLMMQNLVKEALGQEVDLIAGNTEGIDINNLIAAIKQTHPNEIEININNVVENHVDETGGNPINIGNLVINNNSFVDIDAVANINVYLTVFNILRNGDETANENDLDAIHEFLTTNGLVGGVAVSSAEVQVTFDENGNPSVTAEVIVVIPSILEGHLKTLSDPETTITSTPEKSSPSNSATFEFGSDKTGSTFKCELDGAGFVPCSSPHTETGLTDGNHTFLVFAINVDGNEDKTPARYVWEVDATTPETTIESGPPSPTNLMSATFTFSSDDPLATFECKINGGAFLACTSPHTYNGLGELTHTVMVRAVDTFGNRDQTPDSHTWTIDKTAPETTITSGPASITNETTATFTFSSSEAGSTFKCALNGGGFSPCTSPTTFTALSDANRTFNVKATDPAGNTDQSPASHNWTVDTIAPDSIIDSGPPSSSASSSATFTFHSTEAGSTFMCNLDGGVKTCTSPITYNGLAAVSHLFKVEATDPAGNTDPTPAQHSWTVTVPPLVDTIIDSGPSDPTNQNSAVFTFHSVPTGATFECKLDGGAWESCINPKTYTGLADGTHTVMIRATNSAGTDPSPATWSWTIDTIPPDTIIDSGPSDPTTSTTAIFNFHATESATFECELDGGGFSPCSSPQTYNGLAVSTTKHIFNVKATDLAGNPDLSPALHSWEVVDSLPCSIFCEDFESPDPRWFADNGVWEIGVPGTTVGPGGCFSGSQCAATVLNGNYVDINSNLVSPSITLPTIVSGEELHLRFWHWFSFALRTTTCCGAANDTGRVFIQEETAPGVWSASTELASYVGNSGGVWTRPLVDLSAHAGKKVRLLFGLVNGAFSGVSSGWYVDEVVILKF